MLFLILLLSIFWIFFGEAYYAAPVSSSLSCRGAISMLLSSERMHWPLISITRKELFERRLFNLLTQLCHHGVFQNFFFPTFWSWGVSAIFSLWRIMILSNLGFYGRGEQGLLVYLFILYLRLNWVGMAILRWRKGKLGILYAVDELGHEWYEKGFFFFNTYIHIQECFMSESLFLNPLYLCPSHVSAGSQVSILIPKRTLIIHLSLHDQLPQYIEKQLLCWTKTES